MELLELLVLLNIESKSLVNGLGLITTTTATAIATATATAPSCSPLNQLLALITENIVSSEIIRFNEIPV